MSSTVEQILLFAGIAQRTCSLHSKTGTKLGGTHFVGTAREPRVGVDGLTCVS